MLLRQQPLREFYPPGAGKGKGRMFDNSPGATVQPELPERDPQGPRGGAGDIEKGVWYERQDEEGNGGPALHPTLHPPIQAHVLDGGPPTISNQIARCFTESAAYPRYYPHQERIQDSSQSEYDDETRDGHNNGGRTKQGHKKCAEITVISEAGNLRPKENDDHTDKGSEGKRSDLKESLPAPKSLLGPRGSCC